MASRRGELALATREELRRLIAGSAAGSRINRKIFATFAGLLFAYSALVQLNDPDPVRWFVLYGSAAVLSVSSTFVSIPGGIFVGLAWVAGLWAATLVPTVLAFGSFTGTEEERELAGLLLVGVASVVLWSGARRPAA